MSESVSDIRQGAQANVSHAVRIIGSSDPRKRIFAAIYTGKKKIKTVEDIASLTGIKSRIRILQEAGKLGDNEIVRKVRTKGRLSYEKYPFYTQHKDEVLRLCKSSKAFEEFERKRKGATVKINIEMARKNFDVKQITIDDIDSFSKVNHVKANNHVQPIREALFKKGLQRILSEAGEYHDWGGETNDLWTTRLKIKDKRVSAAFGLKGQATRGILTPKKMGKRGDQIQRLFRTPAIIFLIQYWSQIDESVMQQMQTYALLKSYAESQRIYYGIIDGNDTCRLQKAYPRAFID